MFRAVRPPSSPVPRAGGSRFPAWLPAALAAAAFVGFAAAFLYELVSYQRRTVEWATGDINSRAHLAAANLAEPLRTQDIAAIQRIGDACEADGVHLLVTTGRGGVFYDSRPQDVRDQPLYSERCPCGEYRVSVGMPRGRMLAPFAKALRGFLLSGLVGIAGVFLFFVVTYRQRVRIRELNRLEAFRREFIADVSHEIKTPLTGILGAVELLEDRSALRLQLENPTLFILIRRESQRLNRLVQSILDLARLEREGDVLHPVETDLAALVRDVARRCGVPCTVSPEASGPATARVDPQLLEQAVTNLIENAKRHSGSAEIAVSLERTGRDVLIAVEDRGVGIPPEHAARIFERFHRVDPARAAETGGAGLGLAIVRKIARLHGGDVTYRPAVPRGSVFTVCVPAPRS